MEDRILFEDNHLIVINKKAGELVQGDKTGDTPLLESVKAFLKKKYNKQGATYLGLVHRLDRPTSGVVLFAKSSKALVRLNNQFKLRTPKKTYWAIVESKPPEIEETLVHYLKKNQEKNKSRGYDKQVKEGKRAELDYKLLGRSKNYYYLEIDPKTGRHHQIRVQLSTIGCIIKGDVKYGGKRTNRDGSIHLHARSIRFIHPIQNKPLTITANPPSDPLWDEMLTLG